MKKAVKDLQPGDILPAIPGVSRRVVLFVASRGGYFDVHTYELGVGGQAEPSLYESGEDIIDVEPCATQKELFALLAIANRYAAGDTGSPVERKIASDLFNKLSPPNPPTHEEVLAALRDVINWGGDLETEAVRKAHDVARRAGLIE